MQVSGGRFVVGVGVIKMPPDIDKMINSQDYKKMKQIAEEFRKSKPGLTVKATYTRMPH